MTESKEKTELRVRIVKQMIEMFGSTYTERIGLHFDKVTMHTFIEDVLGTLEVISVSGDLTVFTDEHIKNAILGEICARIGC